MGLTNELAAKVMESLDGSFVTKDRFNEVNTENKVLKAAVNDRDIQLETLKTSGGDVEALRKQITDLQAENAAKDESHAAEMSRFKLDAAVDKALLAAKAKNPLTVKPLLKLDDAVIQDDGTVKGLAEQLKSIQEAEDTRFLFQEATHAQNQFKGFVPGEKKDGSQMNKPTTTSLADAVKCAIENPNNQ